MRLLKRRSRRWLRRICLVFLLILILFITNILISVGVLNLDNGKPTQKMRKSSYKRNLRIDSTVVPRIVHYTWMKEGEFKLHHYLSVLSVQEYLSPRRIYFHLYAGKAFLRGQFWDSVRKMPNIRVILENPDIRLNGELVADLRHKSIFVRLEALRKHGGIYIDTDVLFLKSAEQLFHDSTTLGKEDYGVSSSIIFSEKNSMFVQKWLETFTNYDPQLYDESAELLRLTTTYQEYVHIEKDSLRRNDLNDFAEQACQNIFHGHCNHQLNYAIKLYYSFYGRNITSFSLDDMHTTFADIAKELLKTEVIH